MPFPSADSVDLQISYSSVIPGYTCKVYINGNYKDSISITDDYEAPSDSPLFFLLLDWNPPSNGIRLGVFKNDGGYNLTNPIVTSQKPYTFTLTGSPGPRNTIHFYSVANQYGMNNPTLVSRGLQYLSRLSHSDGNTTGHAMYKNSVGPCGYSAPHPSEYVKGWCLAGDFPNPSMTSKSIYVTLNKYKTNHYRITIEWIFGDNKCDYGFSAANKGYALTSISEIKFGTRLDGSESRVTASIEDRRNRNRYTEATCPIFSTSQVYFYTPSSTVSTLMLYDFPQGPPWSGSESIPGTDIFINRNSYNPPNDNNNSEVSTIRYIPSVSYTPGS